MPKDDFKKTAITKKIKGRSYEDDKKREADRDAEVDAWIAEAEAREVAEEAQEEK